MKGLNKIVKGITQTFLSRFVSKKELENKKLVEVSAGDYFKILKDKKQKITDGSLTTIYDNCLVLLDKYDRTGQIDAMKKLMFHLETIEKEREVLNAGLDTFVYLNDVKQYVEKVQERVVKIIELEKYEREIPDDVIATYEKVKHLFSKFFVVFTDFTKEHTKKIEKERDPILFGMFQDKASGSNCERLYFIGDWEDEFCDLTLDRLISEMKPQHEKEQIEFNIREPKSLEELRQKLVDLENENKTSRINNNNNSYYIMNTNSTSGTLSTPIVSVIQTEPEKKKSTSKKSEVKK